MSCLQVDTIRPNHGDSVKICCLVSEAKTSADYQGTSATFSTATITDVNIVTGTIGTIQSTRGNFGTVAAGLYTVGSLIAAYGTFGTLTVNSRGTVFNLDVGEGTFDVLRTASSTIGTLYTTIGTIGTLNVTDGTIDTLNVEDGTIGILNVTIGTIPTLNVTDGTIGTLYVTEGTIGSLNVTDGTIGTLATIHGTAGMFRGNDATFGEIGALDEVIGGVSMPIIFPPAEHIPFRVRTIQDGAVVTANCEWNADYTIATRDDSSYGASSLLLGRGNVEIKGCDATHPSLDHYATFTPEHLTLFAREGYSNNLSINTDTSLNVETAGIVLQNTRGGTASVLDHYEEYLWEHPGIIGPWWSEPGAAVFHITRIGKTVTFSWESLVLEGTLIRSMQIDTGEVTMIPERFRPLRDISFTIWVINNITQSLGRLAVSTAGRAIWTRQYGDPITYAPFTGTSGPVYGAYASSVTWITA